MASLTFRDSFSTWAIAVLVTANAAATAALVARRSRWRTLTRSGAVDAPAAVVALATGVVPALALRRAPVDWDARSIWTFHADWLWSGGERAVQAASNQQFVWAHPDYPIFTPSTIAAVWRALGEPTAEVAQAALGVVTVATVALAVVGLANLVRAVGIPSLSGGRLLLPLVALTFALYGVGGMWAFNGYVDFTWAALLGAGAVYSLLSPREGSNALLGALLVAAATCTKNEAMIAGLSVALLGAFRYRDRRPRAALFAIPLGCAVAWNLVYRSFGAVSPSALDRAPGFLTVERIRLVAESIWKETGPTLPLLALATLLGGGTLWRRRRELGIPASPWLWTPALVSLLSVSLPLLWTTRPERVAPVSERVTIGAEVLLLIDVFLTGLTAIAALAHPAPARERSHSPD